MKKLVTISLSVVLSMLMFSCSDQNGQEVINKTPYSISGDASMFNEGNVIELRDTRGTNVLDPSTLYNRQVTVVCEDEAGNVQYYKIQNIDKSTYFNFSDVVGTAKVYVRDNMNYATNVFNDEGTQGTQVYQLGSDVVYVSSGTKNINVPIYNKFWAYLSVHGDAMNIVDKITVVSYNRTHSNLINEGLVKENGKNAKVASAFVNTYNYGQKHILKYRVLTDDGYKNYEYDFKIDEDQVTNITFTTQRVTETGGNVSVKVDTGFDDPVTDEDKISVID